MYRMAYIRDELWALRVYLCAAEYSKRSALLRYLSLSIYVLQTKHRRNSQLLLWGLWGTDWVCECARVGMCNMCRLAAAAAAIASVCFDKPWSVKRSQRGCLLQIYRVPNFIRSNIYFILFDFRFSFFFVVVVATESSYRANWKVPKITTEKWKYCMQLMN